MTRRFFRHFLLMVHDKLARLRVFANLANDTSRLSLKSTSSKGFPLYYFNSEDRPAEVDFLIEKDGVVLPVEVKSGKNYKTHASLDDLLAVSDYGVERALE